MEGKFKVREMPRRAKLDARGTLHHVIQRLVGFKPETGTGTWGSFSGDCPADGGYRLLPSPKSFSQKEKN